MNQRTNSILSWILWIFCTLSGVVLLLGAGGLLKLVHFQKLIAFLVLSTSGYAASYLRILHISKAKRQKKQVRGCLSVLWFIYLLILLDFTLVDDSLGRNIFRVFEWDRKAYSTFFQDKTNLTPFVTIRLFVRAYQKGTLSLIPVTENLLGNLFAFMPFSFFLPCLYKGCTRRMQIFFIVLFFSAGIEILQFLLMTGSPDIDDLLLNVSGALLCHAILQNRNITRQLSKLTFGVWKTEC